MGWVSMTKIECDILSIVCLVYDLIMFEIFNFLFSFQHDITLANIGFDTFFFNVFNFGVLFCKVGRES